MVGNKIILAGVDGCGKTTLAHQLQAEFLNEHGLPYEIVHSTDKTKNDLAYFINLLGDERNIIFDRFYVDQFVYQTTVDRKNLNWLSLLDLAVVENKIISLGNKCKCMFVDTNLDLCLVNCLKDSNDSHYSLDYIEQLYNRYWYFIEYISSVDWSICKNIWGDLNEIN